MWRYARHSLHGTPRGMRGDALFVLHSLPCRKVVPLLGCIFLQHIPLRDDTVRPTLGVHSRKQRQRLSFSLSLSLRTTFTNHNTFLCFEAVGRLNPRGKRRMHHGVHSLSLSLSVTLCPPQSHRTDCTHVGGLVGVLCVCVWASVYGRVSA